jgi:hypothetical protein
MEDTSTRSYGNFMSRMICEMSSLLPLSFVLPVTFKERPYNPTLHETAFHRSLIINSSVRYSTTYDSKIDIEKNRGRRLLSDTYMNK